MTEETTPDARAEALERRLAELESSTQARLVHAELKAAAIRAGMVDLDGLKLLDTSGITLNDNGEVEAAAALMRNLRTAKPWLFGRQNSSSPAAPPPAHPPAAKPATEMTHAEWQAARASLLKHR